MIHNNEKVVIGEDDLKSSIEPIEKHGQNSNCRL